MVASGYLVRVILYRCSDLMAADLNGKSDPYVIFTIGNKTLKSSRINDELNPQWTPPEKFEFVVPEWENEFITIQVYDHDLLSKDDLIGSAIIPLALYAGNRHNELYHYPLVLPDEAGPDPPRSEIHLQVTLTTASGEPVDYFLY
ncbi:hypothetical protein Poli38472_011147 [Pythium oligandrum]|uniref:C2 domain-containing protein n=1 Tax=Pythium oligandrum TaxID=41045 RepID=A0A8K1CRS3_PYTOL|nr:hypothetical protein Poli38472_011147 [Pythium oligandrum]|eukprot:TMW67527.1 hypothetical protein Poli38472_011147 [Pythium oligandrum]